MINKEQKQKFIELGAKGLSFNKISEEINVSKPTLIKLQRELSSEISNLEFLETQAILDEYQVTRTKKIETLTKKLSEIYSVIEDYDIQKLSIKELIALKDNLENQLAIEKKEINYNTGEKEDSFHFDLSKDITIPLN